MSEHNQTVTQRYDAQIAQAAHEVNELLDKRSKAAGVEFEFFARSVLQALRDTTRDGRALQWRVRLFLYDYVDLHEPVADSDAGMPLDTAGETILSGLPALVPWIAELAGQFHGGPCAGLDSVALRRKLASLRTLISYRKDGTGTLRADYSVIHEGAERKMLARCEVVRIDLDNQEKPRQLPNIAKLGLR